MTVKGLSRFREPSPAGVERCEMCAEPLADRHGHVVDVGSRALLCTCRGCHLLLSRDAFTPDGPRGAGDASAPAGPPVPGDAFVPDGPPVPGDAAVQGGPAGRYRAVPERYLRLPAFQLTAADWEELQIPVRTAFFFRNSALGRYVAFYPSPGGATESLLPVSAWERVLAANPATAEARPDVEAYLVDRRPEGFTCHLVPIDACYELVGLVRLHWKGFGGGREAWQAIDGFFQELRRRADDDGKVRGHG
ncbi:DUF5947 family protein [Sphaerisporangium sp. TRM90804]|uniref:DUF5947 family protein n=1 Tax=Sphaerisporangium sp. TRM90804 TaxID=3031113 RepID=UPI002449FAC4|nr:DUF5947 family protein [Sphaerisporangium sp. TRM90804]MDH2429030.1 DUF5947 family protein [Sphaerisporangium sp. TRM90804]